MEIKHVMQDIKTVIKLEGKDKLIYELPDDTTLEVEVVDDVWGNLALEVARIDSDGNTVECATDEYDCEDEVLWAMIENALNW